MIDFDRVQRAVNRRYPFGRMGSTEFQGWLEDAVLLYSRFNPVIKTIELATEADVAVYSLPEDCVQVLSVLYQHDLASGQLSMATLVNRGGTDPEHPSDLVISDINRQTGRRHAWELWRQEGADLVFESGFATSETLQIKYATLHEANEEGYPTIPAADETLVVGLVLAEIYEAEAAAAAVMPDTSEGLGRTTVHHIPGNAFKMVADFRDRLYRKYGGAPVLLA